MPTITLNGRTRAIDMARATYGDLVYMALGRDPNDVLSVTYDRGAAGAQGSLIIGQSVPLVEGMIVNVTDTSGA